MESIVAIVEKFFDAIKKIIEIFKGFVAGVTPTE
jgi:hypothetical protein